MANSLSDLSAIVCTNLPMSTTAPLKLLLIEDDAGIGSTVEHAVPDYGFEIVIKQTMRGALHWLHDHRPDAILLDLMLPDSLSAQSIDSIRLLRRYAPVWVISGEGDDVIWDAVKEAGAAGWSQKPMIKLDILAEELTEIIRRDKLDKALKEQSARALECAHKIESLLTNGSVNGK